MSRRGGTQPPQTQAEEFNLTQAQYGSQEVAKPKYLEAGYINPFMNFIAGENGSGKSALLTAISFALGANAKQTNRSSEGAKGLIKSGQEAALVELKIANKGVGAYKPDVFGDCITIERKITKTATLTIKGADGKKVPGKANEILQGILDFFIIDVKNPLNVMTQDQTRSFLAQCDPKALFQFYAKGTLLEDMMNGLIEVTQILDNMKGLIQDYEKEGPALQQDVDKLTEEVTQCQVLRESKEQLDGLRKRYTWAVAAAFEAKAEALRVKRQRVLDFIQQTEEQMRAEGQSDGSTQEQEAEIQGLIREATQETEELRSQLKVASEALKRAKQAKQVADNALAGIVDDARLAREEVQRALQSKAAAERQLLADDEVMMTQATQEVDGRRRQRDAVSAALTEAAAEANEAQQRHMQANEDVKKTEDEARKLRGHQQALISQKQALSSAAANALALLRPRMPELVQELQRRQREFSAPPVGPVGKFVRLNDANFKLAVDEAIGNMLGDFIVNDNKDALLFTQIARQVGCPGVNAINVWGRLNAPRHAIAESELPISEISGGWFRMMDCLVIDNDAVYNHLVDKAALEKLIICENDKIARDIVFDGRCRSVKSAYLHTTGAQYFKRGLLDVMQRRSEERPPRIGVDVQQEQRAVDQQLSELDRALRGAEGAQAAARQAVTEARAAWEAARRRAQGAAREKEEAEWELTQAERKSQHATQRAAPLSLDTFDERVRDAEEALRRAEEAQGPAAEQAEAAAAALREREAAADEFKPQKRELKERLAELYRQQEVLTGERQNAADERRVKQEKLDRALAGRKAVEQQLADASAQFEQHLAMAEKCCSREDLQKVPVKAKDAEEEAAMAPEKKLEKKLAALVKAVEKEEHRRGRPLEEIEAGHQRAKKRLKTFHRNVEACAVPHDRLTTEVKKSYRRIIECRNETLRTISNLFNSRLGARSHSGRLLVQFENERLELMVQFSGRNGGKVEDLKSLSGGERSFVQLAFVLSLAEKAEGPFRAMDEWDVFMDAVNRKISFDTLIKFAEGKHKDMQFILLTPQDISALKSEHEVKVLRLQAARQ